MNIDDIIDRLPTAYERGGWQKLAKQCIANKITVKDLAEYMLPYDDTYTDSDTANLAHDLLYLSAAIAQQAILTTEDLTYSEIEYWSLEDAEDDTDFSKEEKAAKELTKNIQNNAMVYILGADNA